MQDNILVDALGKPRITDFGLAKAVFSQAGTFASSSYEGQGSLRWQAPELLGVGSGDDNGANKLTTQSDVYAYGCICLEVIYCASIHLLQTD